MMANLNERWVSMEADLDNLKARVDKDSNNEKKVESLVDLCLNKVADFDSIQFYCKTPHDISKPILALIQNLVPGIPQDYLNGPLAREDIASKLGQMLHLKQEPFKDLPPVLMSSLQQVIEKKWFGDSPCLVFCLVSENLLRLKANVFRNLWRKEQIEDLISRIEEKGKNLTELELCLGPAPMRKIMISLIPMKKMLEGLTKLTVLNINFFKMDNSVLAVIGAHCPQLRSLTLMSGKITDEGISYLCDHTLPPGPKKEEYGQCKKLTYLELYGCNVYERGHVTALTMLPELMYLTSGYPLHLAIATWMEMNEGKTLKIQKFIMHSNVKKIHSDLGSALCALPDLTSLELRNENLSGVKKFLNLTKVNSIVLQNVNQLNPSSITLLVSNFKTQLTKLDISGYHNKIDISIIGYHCKFLEKISFSSVDGINHMKYKLIPLIHFAKVKSFYAALSSHYESSFTIPDPVLKCILASTVLEYVCLELYQVSDQVLNWLISEARAHGQVFSQLNNLSVNSNLSDLHVKQIISLSPKLKRVYISKDQIGVNKFVRDNDLHHCNVSNWY